MREIQKFQVGIKALITHQGKLLMLQENSPAKLWELPGGRIDVGEETLPQQEILKREIIEELGNDIEIKIERVCATWIRVRPNVAHVFLVGFHCNFVRGEIVLSDEHFSYRWVTREESYALPLAEGYQPALDQFWKSM